MNWYIIKFIIQNPFTGDHNVDYISVKTDSPEDALKKFKTEVMKWANKSNYDIDLNQDIKIIDLDTWLEEKRVEWQRPKKVLKEKIAKLPEEQLCDPDFL